MTDTTETTETKDDHIEDLCWQWAAWVKSRRHYGAPRASLASSLGSLSSKARPSSRPEPDPACAPLLAAINLAIVAQPDDQARLVFETHYLHRAAPVKTIAARLGISRATWYRTIEQFKARIYPAAQRILADNLQAAEALPHYQAATEQADA